MYTVGQLFVCLNIRLMVAGLSDNAAKYNTKPKIVFHMRKGRKQNFPFMLAEFWLSPLPPQSCGEKPHSFQKWSLFKQDPTASEKGFPSVNVLTATRWVISTLSKLTLPLFFCEHICNMGSNIKTQTVQYILKS